MSTAPNLHAYLARSRANGPGVRAVVWVQGCTLGCPGCFNPESHASGDGRMVSGDSKDEGRRTNGEAANGEWGRANGAVERGWVAPEELADRILADAAALEGVTVSGGEPLQQAEGVLALLRRLRERSSLSVLLFSGYALPEIEALPLGREVLAQADVLVAGRYVETVRLAKGLRGSANKRVHLLTDRYRAEEIERTPRAEAILAPDGTLVLTGIDPI